MIGIGKPVRVRCFLLRPTLVSFADEARVTDHTGRLLNDLGMFLSHRRTVQLQTMISKTKSPRVIFEKIFSIVSM